MNSAILHLKTTVLPGHKIEVSDPDLPVGDAVEVTITLNHPLPTQRQSALEFLDALPNDTWRRDSEESDRSLQEERNSWDR